LAQKKIREEKKMKKKKTREYLREESTGRNLSGLLGKGKIL